MQTSANHDNPEHRPTDPYFIKKLQDRKCQVWLCEYLLWYLQSSKEHLYLFVSVYEMQLEIFADVKVPWEETVVLSCLLKMNFQAVRLHFQHISKKEKCLQNQVLSAFNQYPSYIPCSLSLKSHCIY